MAEAVGLITELQVVCRCMTQVFLWVSAAMDMLNQASVSFLVMDIDKGAGVMHGW